MRTGGRGSGYLLQLTGFVVTQVNLYHLTQVVTVLGTRCTSISKQWFVYSRRDKGNPPP